jgi:hypothetical protein
MQLCSRVYFVRIPYSRAGVSSEGPTLRRIFHPDAPRLLPKVRLSCVPTQNVVDCGRLSPGAGKNNRARNALGISHGAPRRTTIPGPKKTAVQTDDWEPWSRIRLADDPPRFNSSSRILELRSRSVSSLKLLHGSTLN